MAGVNFLFLAAAGVGGFIFLTAGGFSRRI
jgi:hypothetical protein